MERQKQQKINKVQKNRKDNHKDNRKDRAQKKLHRAQYYQVLKHADKIQMFDTEFQNGVHVIMNPEPDGNCQFAAIKHQLQQHGNYRDEAQLRGEAVDHLRKNRCFYEQFIHGSSFDDYLTHMSQDGSYGDILTLMAIMREYNMQCYVVSAAGADHSALVSNDGVYDSNLPLITIGYFPEDKGMHYLSVSVDVDLLRELTEDTVFPTPEPDNFEQDQGETSNIDSLRTKRATLIKERQQKKIKKTRFPFRLLPLLVQEIIVSKILLQNPSMRYVLEKVDGYFVELIRNMNVPRPKIYVSPALIDTVPNPVSVRYFLIHPGRNSGVIQEIRKVIIDSKWANAWLRLRATGISWYEIIDIYYSRR